MKGWREGERDGEQGKGKREDGREDQCGQRKAQHIVGAQNIC